MTRPQPLRVFLVDDHAILRAGVRSLLAASAAIVVVGEAGSGEEALACLADAAPDVVLLDLSLPGMSGLATARAVRAAWPGVRLVALSMHEEAAYVEGFFEAGGSAYVPKSSVESQLIDALLAVARGEYYAPAHLLAELARSADVRDPNRSVRLTPREIAVVRGIARGDTYRAIANDLAISEKTVATYRERAAEKIGARNRAELVRWAWEHDPVE